MIIVEGLDNTGKTTLINHLAERFMLTRVKSPGPAPLLHHLQWITEALTNECVRTIYDRFSVISECIYGQVLRNGSIFKNLSEDLLQLTLQKQPLIIYCRPPPAVIFNWGDRPQMARVKDHAADLLQSYDLETWRIRRLNGDRNVLRYDYTQPGALNELIVSVEYYLMTREEK